jgi:hypothetical protein
MSLITEIFRRGIGDFGLGFRVMESFWNHWNAARILPTMSGEADLTISAGGSGYQNRRSAAETIAKSADGNGGMIRKAKNTWTPGEVLCPAALLTIHRATPTIHYRGFL